MSKVGATLVSLCLLAGCFSDRSPGDVEGRFLDKYYVEIDQPAALLLCDGPAAQRVEAEIQDLAQARRQGLDAAPVRPRISYRKLDDRPPPAPGEREVEYTLSIDSGGVRLQKRVDLILRSAEGRWKIYNFGEADVTQVP